MSSTTIGGKSISLNIVVFVVILWELSCDDDDDTSIMFGVKKRN